MFLYFILLKKLHGCLKKNVCLYISMSQTLQDRSHFLVTCLSKYGKNIFELTLTGFNFQVKSFLQKCSCI